MSEGNQKKLDEKISPRINSREYEKDDAESVKSLMSELGYSLSEEDLLVNIAEIQQRDGIVFVAELDNQVIGCICAMIDARLAEGVSGEIVSLIVADNFRGVGVGKDLVEVSEKWLAKRVEKVRVRANAIRTDAHSFYGKLGYKEVKNQKVFIKEM